MKLLTISDFGVKTGFSRVMESIVERFPESWDIYSLGINYFGDPYESRSKIYPASTFGDLYGRNRVEKIVKSIKPDRIFILQDSWIVKDYLDIIPEEYLDKTVVYTPVDAGPYQLEWLKKYPLIRKVVAYTEFGKKILSEANPEIPDIKIIPHGIDTSVFFPIDIKDARSNFKSLTDDLFIVLNTN